VIKLPVWGRCTHPPPPTHSASTLVTYTFVSAKSNIDHAVFTYDETLVFYIEMQIFYSCIELWTFGRRVAHRTYHSVGLRERNIKYICLQKVFQFSLFPPSRDQLWLNTHSLLLSFTMNDVVPRQWDAMASWETYFRATVPGWPVPSRRQASWYNNAAATNALQATPTQQNEIKQPIEINRVLSLSRWFAKKWFFIRNMCSLD
jgi:hypothetical protein